MELNIEMPVYVFKINAKFINIVFACLWWEGTYTMCPLKNRVCFTLSGPTAIVSEFV